MIRAAYVIAGLRSPIGKAPKGSLRYVRPDDLLAHVIKSLLNRVESIKDEPIDDVVIGCATPEAEQGLNIARIAAIRAGIPVTTPAFTLNRFCSSGLEAIAIGASRIMLGMADIVIAGGVESMSRLPMGGWHPSPNPSLMKEYPDAYLGMGQTAENLAEKYQISREEQDQFSYESHKKALAAMDNGKFSEEIVPVPVTMTRYRNHEIDKEAWVLDHDEGPRRDTSLEALAKLKPVFKQNGTVTAGNSSQMSDGAAAVILASEDAVRRLNLTPWLRFHTYTCVGVEPEFMGIGPVHALRKLEKKTGVKLADVDVIELNEAFAAQILSVLKEIPEIHDPERLNPNGGAIALGHPLGCTGTRQTVTLMHEMRRRKAKYGIVSMCVGGGMGAAALFEGLFS